MIDLAEFGLLVVQRRFGAAQQFGLGRKFLFGGAQLLLHRLRASSEKIVAFFSPSSIFMRLMASVSC